MTWLPAVGHQKWAIIIYEGRLSSFSNKVRILTQKDTTGTYSILTNILPPMVFLIERNL
jgi:hypothetical protein